MDEPNEPNEQNDPNENFDWKLLKFFENIMRTVFVFLFWMLVNIFFGLYLGFGVPEESTPARLTGFYIWLGLSTAAYIYLIWRLWRKKMPPPDK